MGAAGMSLAESVEPVPVMTAAQLLAVPEQPHRPKYRMAGHKAPLMTDEGEEDVTS
jgi:hypothetical protein